MGKHLDSAISGDVFSAQALSRGSTFEHLGVSSLIRDPVIAKINVLQFFV